MKKYMVLMLKKSYFFKHIDDNNIYEIYKTKNNIQEFFRKVCIKTISFVAPYFFGIWKKNILEVDCIVIFDNGYKPIITKYIKKKNPKIKIIFYFWNVINKRNKKAFSDNNIDEIWTFDKNISNKYKIKYFPQFCNKCMDFDNTKKYDVFFLGKVKDRECELNEIKNILEEQNLIVKIITPNNKNQYYTYEEYLEIVASSKAMIEVVGKSQVGLTLRAIEAQLYKKKLITNNKNIREYDFYNNNNIFILGQDNLSDLYEFVQSSYKDIDDSVLKKYSYNNFIETLIK